MSLLSTVEQAIKLCKAEQTKINDSIQFYGEILQSLRPQPNKDSKETECADDAVTDTSTSPGEKEDMELLEQALEKALRVRTGSRASKEDTNRNKQSGPRTEPGATYVTSKDVMQSSAASKGSHTTIRSTSMTTQKLHKKHASSASSTLGSRPTVSYNPGQSKATSNRNIIQNPPTSSAGVVHATELQAAKKLKQAGSVSGSRDHISTLNYKRKSLRSNVLSDNTVPISQTDESGAHSLPQHNGILPEQIAKWKSLKRKQNRLWDKVIAAQRNPVPGKCHFMERMRAMFPKDWPCGSPDQTRALVNRLIHQVHDITQHCQTIEHMAKDPRAQVEAATEIGGEEHKCDSNLTHERLQVSAAELKNCADQAKQEWEVWNRWRPEGGCLCPTGANGVWGDGVVAALPLTITYTTEAELRELEKLRMRVALLQQEIYLEQALLDTLFPQLLSIVPGLHCPDPSVLRDMYSLLGEGGEHFPAIVLDSD
ncbi:tubulin epsilon and delta complex protein 2 [Mastacembelus armatus]|uniref:tubulin epsilon and delta complex protein 2 n=1 Tax=Mastacembelus armatus TaxID=205130 RepID=UPI000E45526A|nr:tubulin epsilon and delta complex protein 2-like [Mastacembelus armatus]XP_026182052.1 tubulin epsilon and delta complex protein 2-like [Mastacembelus armatus]